MNNVTAERRRLPRRRAWLVTLLGLTLVMVLGVVWLLVGLLGAAGDARAQAGAAQSSLQAAAAALSDGDVPAARLAVDRGTSAVSAAQGALARPQVAFVASIPVVGRAVEDARALADAADHATAAASAVTEAYASAKGTDGGSRLFAAGRVDAGVLNDVLDGVVVASQEVAAAQQSLDEVEADLPGTGSLAEARDAARKELDQLQGGLDSMAAAAPSIPSALGFGAPRTYLLGILNSAELRASGGPPLAAALLRFDEGRLRVVARGQTGVVFTQDNPRVNYVGADGSARYDRFVNATADSDFRMAGIDLVRSWEASTGRPVDGVITVDAVALAALLDATGPIDAPGYGEVTGDTFVQTVLVDAYERFAGAQEDRQQLNTLMIDALAERLTTGDSTLPVLRTLGSTAASRNVQMWFSDATLESAVEGTDLAGAVADTDEHADRIAVFSQNVNRSKVDVFQNRTITSDVRLEEDGSAEVRQEILIENDTPSSRRSDRRTYYRTGWSRNLYRIYVADAARQVAVMLPPGTEGKQRGQSVRDTRGRPYVMVDAWIPPAESLAITVSYRLPTGTFTDGTTLVYRLLADPQALVRPAQLAVSLTAPEGRTFAPQATLAVNGRTATWSGAFTRPLTLSAVAQ